jgi:hypothetical protein
MAAPRIQPQTCDLLHLFLYTNVQTHACFLSVPDSRTCSVQYIFVHVRADLHTFSLGLDELLLSASVQALGTLRRWALFLALHSSSPK